MKMALSSGSICESSSSVLLDLPLYPVNADIDSSLKEVSTITINNGTQVILTYAGERNFTVLESKVTGSEEFILKEIDGEIIDIYGTFGYSVSNTNINKIYFVHNGVSYQIWSDSESVATLIEVASGMELVDAEK